MSELWTADDWHLFLCQHCDNRATSPNGLNTVALKIADTMDEIRRDRSGVQSRNDVIEECARIAWDWFHAPLEMKRRILALKAGTALSVVPEAADGRTAENIYANAYTTLIGFRNELTEDQIKFICDQISRKVALALPSATLGGDDV